MHTLPTFPLANNNNNHEEILVSIFLFLPPSHTPWLASQALQLASKTSGWPLIHLAGLPDPLANLLTLHLASLILSLILKLASQTLDQASKTLQQAS